MITERYTDLKWDFDGTLFDSYPHTAAALVKTLEEYGTVVDAKEAEGWLRITVGTAIRHYGLTEEQVKTLYKYEYTDDFQPIITIYEGCEEALRRIHARGGRHYLFTHRDNKAYKMLDEQGILSLFTDIITVDNGFALKPAPDAILHLVEKHGLDKDKTVMIGDREIDIGSGINAGVHTLLFDEFERHPGTEAEELFSSYRILG